MASPWTEAEIELLIATREQTARDVAAQIGRTQKAVQLMRSQLVREGRMPRGKPGPCSQARAENVEDAARRH
jgi:hypothetical protein